MTADGTNGSASVRSLDDIAGWFPSVDQRLFEHFLGPDAVVTHGDLVEIGVYLGKSAVLIGAYKRPDEVFTVCDLFGAEAVDEHNVDENSRLYKNLTRSKFEANYTALRGELPVIVAGLSSTIVDHVKPESARFVHVDGSHMYEHVAGDADSARTMLLPDGVVVFDDYRSGHTPGVAAAVWEAVLNKGLQIIVLTGQKMYATFGDAAPHQERVEAWLTKSELPWEYQSIAGRPVLRIKRPPTAPQKPAPVKKAAPAAPNKSELAAMSAQLQALNAAVQNVSKSVAAVETQVARSNAQRPLWQRGLGRAKRMVASKSAGSSRQSG